MCSQFKVLLQRCWSERALPLGPLSWHMGDILTFLNLKYENRFIGPLYAVMKSPTTAPIRPGRASATNARFGESAGLGKQRRHQKVHFFITYPILTRRLSNLRHDLLGAS